MELLEIIRSAYIFFGNIMMLTGFLTIIVWCIFKIDTMDDEEFEN